MTSCTNEHDVLQKIQGARKWVAETNGQFTGYVFGQETGFMEASIRNDLLAEFVESGIIEPTGDRHGTFKKVDKDLVEMDWRNAKDQPIPIRLPLGLNNLCTISEQNVIVLAGESNSGKSELALRIAHDNLAVNGGSYADIDYFTCEFSPPEFKGRVMKIDREETWDGIHPYQRYEDYHSVIKPNRLTIIDYLEVHDNFYLIGGLLDKIHQASFGGVTVVCLQKKSGNEFGIGGGFTQHRTRLMVSIAYNKDTHLRTARIVKAKAPIGMVHPDGMQMDYALEGRNVRVVHGWAHVTPEQRKARDEVAARELRNAEMRANSMAAADEIKL